MVNNFYSNSMSRSESSSPIDSYASIDINDDEDEEMSVSPKREDLSPVVHQNGSVNCNKPSKLSFSISRLLAANSGPNKHNANGVTEGESESEFASSLCSRFPSNENIGTTVSYSSPSSPRSKCLSQSMTISAYDPLTNPSSVMRLPAHRPPTNLPYNAHYPWLASNPSTLIKDGLQSELIQYYI